jgi:GH18 family chitinase
VDWSGAWDYDELASISDGLMIMAYDYHWKNAPTTGPVAPLTGWGTYNVTWTVNDYLTWSGGLNDKLILGCPYYGYDWPAESGEAGANTDTSGIAKTYSSAEQLANSYGKLRDNDSQSPWYRYQDSGWHQCWYDDSLSLSLKYDLVNQFDLQGVGIWALGYDGDRTELWAALEEKFTSTISIGDEVIQPSSIFLYPAYPNPFNAVTTIRYSIVTQDTPLLRVYDLKGRLVETLVPDNQENGIHEIHWNASNYPAGIYFISLSNRSEKVIQKISFIK